MKHVETGHDESSMEAGLAGLCQAVLAMRNVDEVQQLLEDLCTPAELEALIDRWRVIPLLKRGKPYRQIHDETGVSVTTIGRVARYLQSGAGGYELAYERTCIDRDPSV